MASKGPIPQPLWIRYSPSCQSKIVETGPMQSNAFCEELLSEKRKQRELG